MIEIKKRLQMGSLLFKTDRNLFSLAYMHAFNFWNFAGFDIGIYKENMKYFANFGLSSTHGRITFVSVVHPFK